LAQAGVRPAPAARPSGKRSLYELWVASAAEPGVPHRAPPPEPLPADPPREAPVPPVRQAQQRWPDEPRLARRRPQDWAAEPAAAGPIIEAPNAPAGPPAARPQLQPEVVRYPSTGLGYRRSAPAEAGRHSQRPPQRAAASPVRLPSPFPTLR
jgi:hypothetical protein